MAASNTCVNNAGSVLQACDLRKFETVCDRWWTGRRQDVRISDCRVPTHTHTHTHTHHPTWQHIMTRAYIRCSIVDLETVWGILNPHSVLAPSGGGLRIGDCWVLLNFVCCLRFFLSDWGGFWAFCTRAMLHGTYSLPPACVFCLSSPWTTFYYFFPTLLVRL